MVGPIRDGTVRGKVEKNTWNRKAQIQIQKKIQTTIELVILLRTIGVSVAFVRQLDAAAGHVVASHTLVLAR